MGTREALDPSPLLEYFTRVNPRTRRFEAFARLFASQASRISLEPSEEPLEEETKR